MELAKILLEAAKMTAGTTEGRERAITRLMKTIRASYNDQTIAYPDLTDTMEELVQLAYRQSPKQDENIRIRALSAVQECLQIVADAKEDHGKQDPVTIEVRKLWIDKNFPDLKNVFSERMGSVDWTKKMMPAEDVLGVLAEIAALPSNPASVQSKAFETYHACEKMLLKMVLPYQAAGSAKLVSQATATMRNGPVH